MFLLISDTHNPYFNIATEEYLLHYTNLDGIFVYQNSPSIIIGRNQNPYAEVNISYAEEKCIPVIRRMSGGGSVYHDEGNLNVAYFSTHAEKEYAVLLNILIKFLEYKNIVDVEIIKNGIFIKQQKISGLARHVSKNRSLCHGTLLINTNLKVLNELLTSSMIVNHRSVRSNKSVVTNLSYYTTISDIISDFTGFLLNQFSEIELMHFTGNDIQQIALLENNKYSLWDWNFGMTPDFSVSVKMKTTLDMKISKGRIVAVNSEYEYLKGEKFEKMSLIRCMKNLKISENDILRLIKQLF